MFNTLGMASHRLYRRWMPDSRKVGVSGLSLSDPDGKPVPLQVLDQERYGDGGFRRAKIAFVRTDFPRLATPFIA